MNYLLNLMEKSGSRGIVKMIASSGGHVIWDNSHNIFVRDLPSDGEWMGFVAENQEALGHVGMIKVHLPGEGTCTWHEGFASGLSAACQERSMLSLPVDRPIEARWADVVVLERGTMSIRELGQARLVLEEIESTWGSVLLFEKWGFGVCKVISGEVAAWCLSEYNSDDACGIGIEVRDGFRREGIAVQLAGCLAEQCRRRGIMPFWDSWSRNVGSVRTAEKAGFQVVERWPAMVVDFR